MENRTHIQGGKKVSLDVVGRKALFDDVQISDYNHIPLSSPIDFEIEQYTYLFHKYIQGLALTTFHDREFQSSL